MLFVLIGESGSGKSTIQKKLLENGMNKVVTYTTRPKRVDEINNIDYQFVSEKYFKYELLDKKVLLEHAVYNDWHYGYTLDGINYAEADFVLVCTPSGFEALRKKVGTKNVMSIYFNVHERERLMRLARRGDDIDEIFRRIVTDRIDFRGIQHSVDMVVNEREMHDLVGKLLAINKRGVKDER